MTHIAIHHPFIQRTALLVLASLIAVGLAMTAAADTAHLELDNHGLEPLGHGFVYEGWLIVDGAAVSAGRFAIAADGSPSRSSFAVEVADLDAVSSYVLTIEPVPDADPGPSPVHVLAGDFANGTAELTAGHDAALGDDFSAAAGSYILAAPSAGGTSPYGQGIWWLDPDGGPDATLHLPTLPAGWVYEGWVVGDGGPMSTGRFTMPSGADSDAGGIAAGPYATPPFPGQDFITPAIDLTSGYAAVISIEPEPDDSPAPFAFKPLVDTMIEDVGEGVPQSMDSNAGGFPTATVTLHGSMVTGDTAHLRLDLHGLEDLGAGWAYEGWLIVDGAPVSTGVFTVDGSGVASQTYFPTLVPSLDAVAAFVLTIEPSPDDDPAPSPVHILAGDVIGDRAALTVGHAAAIGTGFESIAGSYILAAPSAGGAAPYFNGIWWLDPSGGPDATLHLPDLPDGWVYEGWVVGDSGPVSTGRFTTATGADSDGAGPDAGPMAAPPFPGQDFVDPALDLRGGAAVISVEPEPDTGPAPFTLKPLLDPVIDDVGEGVLQPMSRNPAPLPSGLAVLLRETLIPAGGNVVGFGGARWHSDLDIANHGTMPAGFTVQLLAADQGNPSPRSLSFMLEPGASVRYVDAFESLFGFEGTGALRVLVDGPEVSVASRTYAADAAGSYGQGIPAHLMGRAIRFGETGRLVGLSESGVTNDGFRTNIGLVNATGSTVTVAIELFAGDGSPVDVVEVDLAGYEQRQLSRIYPVAVEVGYAVLRTTTPGGAFFAYGSVVDNQTFDPTFIAVQ
ncbi:MAG TPA: anti-sigma factor [Candidatus Sulfomarinibacteraceae bacterium]|nr:anti-sigma factor [Candidatus Sulfomarinibacteraceae bacterium]